MWVRVSVCAELLEHAEDCPWLMSDGLLKISASRHRGMTGQGQAENPQFWVPTEEKVERGTSNVTTWSM